MEIKTSDKFCLDKTEVINRVEERFKEEILQNKVICTQIEQMVQKELEKNREYVNFDTYFFIEQVLNMLYEFLFMRVRPIKEIYENEDEMVMYYYQLGKEAAIVDLINGIISCNLKKG